MGTVVLAWLIGGGLLAAPPEIGDAVRAPLRDALSPGQTLIARAETALRERLAVRSGDARSDQEESLRAERDRWRARFLELQARRVMDDNSGSGAADLPPQVTPPLIVADFVPARVLGQERDPLRLRVSRLLDRGRSDGIAVDDIVLADTLPLLDLGSDAEIEPDMPVVVHGCALGRIRQCGRWTSTVQPLTDPEFRAFVQIVRPTPTKPLAGAEGLLAGNGDGTCRMELIDGTAPVSVGDFVYGRLSDFDVPPCFGRITAAELPEGAACWRITVTPIAGLAGQRSVQILRELPNPARIAELSSHQVR